ncbi:50S ribosomal protein L19 [Candidatus Dojkabacteria bacterium]|nr:50S ribosomal protein L19 [Candidatus Dojkabacteria bacterium]
MNTELLNKVEQVYLKKDLPEIGVGDTIEVVFTIRAEKKGEKKRSQTFKGLVIAIKGSGARKSVTIRKISYGVGVEKIFPLHSPTVQTIKILRKGKVRQSNIFYMRERIGKKAMKVKEGEMDFNEIIEGSEQEVTEKNVEVAEEESKEEKEEVVEEVKEEKKD